jgi:hypothetical protein
MAGVASARIANRHALYSVYYGTTKKTALPLNETYTRAECAARQHDYVARLGDDCTREQRAMKFVRASSILQKIR